MAKKIMAYDRITGRKYEIPERWLLGKHPQFKRFKKTPRQRQADRDQFPASEPDQQKQEATEPVAATSEKET